MRRCPCGGGKRDLLLVFFCSISCPFDPAKSTNCIKDNLMMTMMMLTIMIKKKKKEDDKQGVAVAKR